MIARRSVLKSTVALGILTFTGTLPGLRAGAQATPPLRRSLQGMDLDDPVLITLRDFVRMMSDPSRAGEPVNWLRFSEIHGNAGGFNLCPHGNWYFLPWHRGYIRSYEVAARALTGDAGFAMPYWDWTAQPDFPAAFGDATFNGNPNPLFVPGRAMTTGDAMSPGVTGQAVMDSIFAKQTYEEFGSSRATGQNSTDPSWISARGTQGELESNPHNNVHCDIFGPFMCSGASPLDPIFQMHHANIDHIWAVWVAQGRANSTNPMWLDMPFTDNFIKPDGSTYSDVVKDLLEVEPLGYTYGLGTPPNLPPVDPGRDLYLAQLYGAPLGLNALTSSRMIETVNMQALPDAPLNLVLRSASMNIGRVVSKDTSMALELAGQSKQTVYAFIRKLDPVDHETTRLRVFVNEPEANAESQTAGNPHYVTTIGFFGPSGMHGDMDMRSNVAVDLTPALRQLSDAGLLATDNISVQLVPVKGAGEAAPAPVGLVEVELAVV